MGFFFTFLGTVPGILPHGWSLPSTMLLAATQSLSQLVLCSGLSKALMLWIVLVSEFVKSIQQISISDPPQSWLCGTSWQPHLRATSVPLLVAGLQPRGSHPTVPADLLALPRDVWRRAGQDGVTW